jgi:hypothetical protein
MKLLNIFKRSTVKSRLENKLQLLNVELQEKALAKTSKDCRPREYYELGIQIGEIKRIKSVLTEILNG